MYRPNENVSPWSVPLQPAGVVRPRKPVGENGLLYTPNEPGSDEEMYAAKAAAARSRTEQLRAAQLAEPSASETFSSDGAAAHPAAVLYSSTTGIHPQSEPETPFAETDEPKRVLDAAMPSRPAPLRRRRRQAVEEEPLPQTGDYSSLLTESGRHARIRTDALLAASKTDDHPARQAYDPKKQSFAPIEERGTREETDRGGDVALLVNTTTAPFGLHPGLEWNVSAPTDGAAPEETPPAGNPEPAPLPDPVEKRKPAPRRGNGFLVALIVLMLLAALAGFLWLSGIGESVLDSAKQLFTRTVEPTIATGEMLVIPDNAAVPTNLTVTLSTDSSIVDLRLLDDKDRILDADVICNPTGEDCIWMCRLAVEQPYTGFIRAQLLTRDGNWVMGSSGRHVNLN
ncbi:MAG: hypothetical protein IKK08_01995 [Clostridia bacterium]|nr:hypothetical protein [Clostridia bacterium]